MNLDKSIKLKNRSIDRIKFSKKYCHPLILIGRGIILVVCTVHIYYNLNYIPFENPCSVLCISLQILIFHIL